MTPRDEDSVNESRVIVVVLLPPSIAVYSVSNVMVEQAALVQASVGPATSVFPEIEKVPPHTLQSARVDKRPSVKVTVYVAPSGRFCFGCPAD